MELSLISISLVFMCLVCQKSTACDITHECADDQDLTWATDGKVCHVFHNKCFLDNVNCHHMNNNDPKLNQVPREECQKLCVTQCPQDDNPVCGYYKETKTTFPNQCMMEAHICQTGETLYVYGIGPCD